MLDFFILSYLGAILKLMLNWVEHEKSFITSSTEQSEQNVLKANYCDLASIHSSQFQTHFSLKPLSGFEPHSVWCFKEKAWLVGCFRLNGPLV